MHSTNCVGTWQPCENLIFDDHKTLNYAVVILNSPIHFKFSASFLLRLWNQAKVKITVDGGTERWLDWLKFNNFNSNKDAHPPDLITGDMDSLPQDILQLFVDNGHTQVVKTPDQNETDFTKALRQLKTFCQAQEFQLEEIYVIADTSGRLDQIIGNINTLFKARNILPDVKVFQLASDSISWLLNKGLHTINVPRSLRNKREWCALIPMTRPCCVTTTGLKWNLNKTTMEFGGLVSTSNTYSGEAVVTVETDNTIVWSMGIESLIPMENHCE